jgi:hypothetical protein
MDQITLTSREANRLINLVTRLPLDTSITLTKRVTSEFGSSVFVEYNDNNVKIIDLTETDNF